MKFRLTTKAYSRRSITEEQVGNASQQSQIWYKLIFKTYLVAEFETDLESENSIEHIESEECQRVECQCAKKRYVQIIDVDRYIFNLNDWD